MDDVTTAAPIAETRAGVVELDHLSDQSRRRFDEMLRRFETFVERAYDVSSVDALTAEHLGTFIRAKASGRQPSVATMHLRRSALRLLFRVARQSGVVTDLTCDIELPPRSSLSLRPLLGGEVTVGAAIHFTH